MIVQSLGALKNFASSTTVLPDYGNSYGLHHITPYTYGALYRTQPNVRTVIDFIARNIAQVAPLVYRRVTDLDRVRLVDHELVQWLGNPNPGTCRYRLFESLMQDLGIYFNAYWLKIRQDSGAMGLVRLSPEHVMPTGWIFPTGYLWAMPDGQVVALTLADVVHFNGYDPADPVMGISPLETLRQVLAEDAASTAYRRAYWTNSARLEGVITRPKDAPKWSPEQKQAFREQWKGRFAGTTNAGQTAVLEDGMSFTATSYSARESEFVMARKLTREEVAAQYHVPQPMVGILDHATFSNIKEQHKQLYQDCLGPWLEWIQEEIEKQLLPDCTDTANVYLEFNIAEKMKGSFEEQAAALKALVGRPIMTANEGRSRLNLPSIKNDPTADELALPMNTTGGPSDSFDGTRIPPTPAESAQIAPILDATRTRQIDHLQRLPASERASALFAGFDRWQAELVTDLAPIIGPERAAAMALEANVSTAMILAGLEHA